MNGTINNIMNGITNNRCVKLYDDINVYNKQQIYFGCGNIPNAGNVTNKISAIEIPTRTCTTFHSKSNYEGNAKIFCNYSYQNNKIFSRTGELDDRMQSMRVFDIKDD